MVTTKWFSELPEETRLDVLRAARQGQLHPDPLVGSDSVKWAHLMRPGGAGYSALNMLIVAFETMLSFVGFGQLGEESSVSGRIAAKRIVRIAQSSPD